MASERMAARRLRLIALVPALALAMGTGAIPVTAAEPWWVPLGLPGQAVTAVTLDDAGAVVVRTPSGNRWSNDGGRTFQAAPGPAATARSGGCVRGVVCAARRLQGGFWQIREGRVVVVEPSGSVVSDKGSPDLGRRAGLIAAPPLGYGAPVAVAEDGTVWRRAPDGSWGRSLLLLPSSPIGGVPAVTSIAAFPEALTGAVYLGVDGYSVLISNDGGEDWTRAGPGLPDRVLSLAADTATRSVYAGTADGLWVHHVQRLPGPPDYADNDLWLRWLGVVLVALSASAAALGGVWWASAQAGGRRCSMGR